MEILKSFELDIILNILFIPLFYLIAVIDKYYRLNNMLPIVSKYSIWDIFKKYNIKINYLHRIDKYVDAISQNDLDLILTFESPFKLDNNFIYWRDVIIGKYDLEIPSGECSKYQTKYKKMEYYLDYENSTDEFTIAYFTYNNISVKLFIKRNYVPMHIWSSLIEDIYEFNLLWVR